jgi:hypothetical protein
MLAEIAIDARGEWEDSRVEESASYSSPLTHTPNKFIDVSQRLILGVTSAWSPTTDD